MRFHERIKTHHSAMAEGKKYLLGPKSLDQVLMDSANPHPKSVIYIHVPFCPKICTFCNMRRSLSAPVKEYAHWIVEEIKQYASYPYVKNTVFDAVYFGGGTPTMLSSEQFTLILRALKENFQFTEDAEFTVETTVTQLTEEKRKVLIQEGINRFSVGVQTFHPEGRKSMGRIGDGSKAYDTLKKLKNENVTVSMDLIYNYKGQTLFDLIQDLNHMIELDLDGFSMYSLIDMKETTIDVSQSIENDKKMYDTIVEHMHAAGYQFLELTKMVTRDQYRYIMNRHQGADTLALGAGAGGSMNGLAIMNPIDLKEYEQSIIEFKQRKGMHFHADYKQIVCMKGDIQTTWLPRNLSLYQEKQEYEIFLQELLQEEMVIPEDGGYRLTPKGIYWGNSISRELSSMIG